MKYAAQVAELSAESTPNQTESWADCKAAYRMFDEDDVTFEAVCRPHWEMTREQSQGVFLLIGDTTEIDFGYDPAIEGLGPVGSGSRRGFLLHSSLMINADTEDVVGLAGAEVFHRVPVNKRETTRQKKNRERESEVWGRVVDLVGRPCGSARLLHVFDRGADNYEVYCHALMQRCGWVVRAAQKHRNVLDSQGTKAALLDLVRRQEVAGTYALRLRARKNQPSRTATLQVRFAPLAMPVPAQPTPFMKACGITDIPMHAVLVEEINPPKNVEPLDWLLLTSEPVESFSDAQRIIGYYEKRPRVEDYHKCLKTGCRLETRQYKTSARLERVAGLLSVVAVRLLQLKFAAREDPSPEAKRIVPPEWIAMIQKLRKTTHPLKTTRDCLRALAMLGGFLGRKSDGEPGWLTIWRGIQKLILCLRGAQAAMRYG